MKDVHFLVKKRIYYELFLYPLCSKKKKYKKKNVSIIIANRQRDA